MQLELTNIINISVSQVNQGVGNYNTSNLALFTHEVPANTFGVLGYSLYLSPQQVGVDFGTASKTFAMANAVFSQQPNILAGGGYLAVIPFVEAQQTLALSGIPASGTFLLHFNAEVSAAINWNDSAAVIQGKLLTAYPDVPQLIVTGSLASESLVISFGGYYGPAALLTVSANSLETSGSVAITITPSTTQIGETYAAAISRTKDLVQYFGLMETLINTQADVLAAAAVIQPLNKIGAFVSRTEADIMTGGTLDLLRSGDLTQSRGLYYGSADDQDALVMMASYMGRGLSTDFTGSNTTSTMHLKSLVGVQPDPSMTQTILNLAIAAGADTYISLQGDAAVFCSGANSFFDQVYNLQWFVGALQVAGFNYLAQVGTKIPQTEAGMSGLKGAYRNICEQAVTNQYSAPGQWNSPTTFGIQADLFLNVGQRGYYIYSQPVSQQPQTNRAARQAPLVQIALKEAGAIQSSSVIVYVNA